MSHAPGAHARLETARVEAFSDGVFAIAITLLILDVRVPHAAGAGLGRALLAQWPSYFAFLTSFATIGIMWLNHHRLFGLIARVDHSLVALNGLLLLGVTVVPFPTAVVAQYLGHPGDRVAAQVYSATFVAIAIVFNLLWRYASSERRQPSLLHVSSRDPAVQGIHAQYRVGPLSYIVALGLAFWDARASVALNLFMALFFALPPRRDAPRPDA